VGNNLAYGRFKQLLVKRLSMSINLKKYNDFTQKGQKRLIDICNIAAQVFFKKGYLKATIGNIANSLGITKGAIFHYFPTKEELLFQILYQYLDTNLKELKSRLNSCDSYEDKIYVFIHNSINGWRNDPAEFHLALHERGHLSKKYLTILKKLEREYVDILKSFIEQVIDKSSLDANQLTLITYSLLGMCAWPYTWFDPGGKSTPEELSHMILRIFMGDLKILTNPKNNCSSIKVKPGQISPDKD